MKKCILIVEDDPAISRLIESNPCFQRTAQPQRSPFARQHGAAGHHA